MLYNIIIIGGVRETPKQFLIYFYYYSFGPIVFRNGYNVIRTRIIHIMI